MAIPPHEPMSLLSDYQAGSPYTIAYHTLYANIRFNWNTQQSRQQSIVLATPTYYPGHSAAAANIAIAAAQNDTPTILVDADTAHPSLQQRFGVGENKGLSDLLISEALTRNSIAALLCQTFVPGLQLLCAGKTSLAPTNLLPATKLEQLVQALSSYLEAESTPGLIIFTSSPVLTGVHTAQLAAVVKQTYLTIVTGRTTRTQAKQAQEQLQRAHANLVGAIMLDI